MANLVSLNELKQITGYKTAPAVEECLTKNGVRFLYGRHGIYTTIDAINAAMGISKDTAAQTEPEISIL
ncbi:MAG: hypothetical protein RIR39_1540 [Pseudomonadota bacterium]|jgi:hypothetical protein